jgi:hypothetical protein
VKIRDAIDNLHRFDPEAPFMMQYCFEVDEYEEYYALTRTYIEPEPEKRRLEVQEIVGNVVYLG